MTDFAARKAVLSGLLDQIRAAACSDHDPAEFLMELQGEIERVPGAQVAFGTRDLSWLKNGYLEDRPEMSDEDLQAAILEARSGYDEGASNQDHVTTLMDIELDRVARRIDEPGPV